MMSSEDLASVLVEVIKTPPATGRYLSVGGGEIYLAYCRLLSILLSNTLSVHCSSAPQVVNSSSPGSSSEWLEALRLVTEVTVA
jgi:hypothetical protein